ncbi:MAG: cation diffusion facilitator family transporter [Candidatus Hodarchaeales archaeon]|jgi:cation diffusion facilitator family transporter
MKLPFLGKNGMDDKTRAAFISVLAALFLTAIKLITGLATNSLGILSEFLHSALDLVAAAMTFFAVRVGDKPADVEHPFGHQRIENLSALFETILLLITCVWIINEAIDRLIHRTTINPGLWGILIMVLAIIIDYNRSKVLYQMAKKYDNQALEADALHFSSDIYSSAVVILGLIFTNLGFPIADPIAALIVSVIIIYISLRLGKRSIDVLLDRSPSGVEERIRDLVEAVPSVERCGRVRARGTEEKIQADVTVFVSSLLSIAGSHQVSENVEKIIKEDFIQADVVVHVEPLARGGLESTVSAIAVNYPEIINIHSIYGYLTDGSFYLDAHIVFPETLSISKAHQVMSGFKTDLMQSIPGLKDVNLHFEESREDLHVITCSRDEDLKEDIINLLAKKGFSCETVMVKSSGELLWISVTCLVNPNYTVKEAHELASKIETWIHAGLTGVNRINVQLIPSDSEL